MSKLLKNIIVLFLAVYALYILVSQQKTLNTYTAEKKQYSSQINEAVEEKSKLTNTLEGINSTEYIEEVARNVLDMRLPNEHVYIDITK